MPVPKRKRSRARRDKRFANKGLKVGAVMTCKTCSAPLLGHQACHTCGHYKGVKVMTTKAERQEGRTVTRQARAHAEAAKKAKATPSEQS